MPKLQRYANLGAVVLPFIAFLIAVPLLWNKAVGWVDLTILVLMYCVTGLGITVGYHRLLTHRAFATSKPFVAGFVLHAFPRSARQGLGRFEVDLSAMVIWTLEKVGLAHNVVRISPERQKEKLAAAQRVKAAA